MEEKRDNIYIYLWEKLNAVYVGRTVSPKSRHWAHKHRETEPTYKFSREHNVEHPKMIIIESGLTIEEGVEREKYWIEEYKNNKPYSVINKSKGGETGTPSMLTEAERKEKRKERQRNYRKEHEEELRIKKKDIQRDTQRRDSSVPPKK